MRTYFRDVHDHLERVQEQVDTFRDVLTSVLEANLTRVSVRQNADMRKISAWVAIAAIPTLVGGIYGMNFEHMPELGQEWAYPGGVAPHRDRLRVPLPEVPAQRLALSHDAASTATT